MNDSANPFEASLLREPPSAGGASDRFSWVEQTRRDSLTGLLARSSRALSHSFDGSGSLVPVVEGRNRGSSLVTFVQPGLVRRDSIVSGEHGAHTCIAECGCNLARGEWTISRRCRTAHTAAVLSVSLVTLLSGAVFAFGISLNWCRAYIDPPRCADCEDLNLWIAGEGFAMIAIGAVGSVVAFTSAGQLAVQATCAPGRRGASDDDDDDGHESTRTSRLRGEALSYAPPQSIDSEETKSPNPFDRVRTPRKDLPSDGALAPYAPPQSIDSEETKSPNPFDRVRTPDSADVPTMPPRDGGGSGGGEAESVDAVRTELQRDSCLPSVAPKCNCAGLALLIVYTLTATGWWIWGTILFVGGRPVPAASIEDQSRCASIQRIGRCVPRQVTPQSYPAVHVRYILLLRMYTRVRCPVRCLLGLLVYSSILEYTLRVARPRLGLLRHATVCVLVLTCSRVHSLAHSLAFHTLTHRVYSSRIRYAYQGVDGCPHDHHRDASTRCAVRVRPARACVGARRERSRRQRVALTGEQI